MENMRFVILYHELVARQDIPHLSQEWRKRICDAIEKKLTINPEIYGKPLGHSLKGYRKLRVSDYRVIFRIENDCVKIFLIQHRSVVYRNAKRRM